MELEVSLGIFVGDDMGGLEGDNDCEVGEENGFGLDGG